MTLMRLEGIRFYEEVLERILDRGMIVDGLSHLAALDSPLLAQAEKDDNSEQKTPTALVSPPRTRDRV